MRAVRQRFLAVVFGLHRWAYRVSGGLVGGRLLGRPVLLLTTTGRRSGRPHTTALTYLPHGTQFVLIASNGGAAQHPAWYLNLRAHPRAQVQVGRTRLDVLASDAVGEDRDRFYARAIQSYRGYAAYQTRTTRRIPVVLLEPMG